jgi:sugar lactone lactonase YvrE
LRQTGLVSSSLLIGILGSCSAVAQQCAISTPVAAVGTSIGTPGALAADNLGSVYFTTGNCVLRIDANGMLTRVAGASSSGYSGDGATASAAQLNAPGGLALDSAGNLFISDTSNHRVRVVTPDGNIGTIAGTGVAGYSGDGGPAFTAALNGPQGLAADPYGDIYIADTNNSVVRKISPAGVITTYAGVGSAGYSYDGFFAHDAQLNLPTGLAVSSGNLYIADSANNRVRLVTAARLITTFAGNGTAGYYGDNGVGGQSEDAELNLPTFVASDALGTNIYISDSANQRIRHVLPDTIITTAVGGDKGVMTPAGLALDSNGNLFIADSANARIVKLSPDGALTTVAGQ